MKVLVLGAYGLIGQAVVDRLVADGHGVVGLGRRVAVAQRTRPHVDWRQEDIARLTSPASWRPLLDNVQAVVNASGALQTGLKDDVAAVQDVAMRALFTACEQQGVSRFVQISAPGVSPAARTLFLRSKAAADEALKAGGLSWVILRPAVVIARTAYGGTALIRALASLPWITPLVEADAQIRTVGIEDVSHAVAEAVSGALPAGCDLILAEDEAHTLADILAHFRQWLGAPQARLVSLPAWLGRLVGVLADGAGWLGWRSPLRSTAIDVLSGGGVTDLPASSYRCDSLAKTLARTPATPQDRWFARLWLLKPLIFLVLAAFWIVSGLVGFLRQDAAQAVLAGAVSHSVAYAAVLGGSALDVALGVAVLFRPLARAALLGMIAVTVVYMEAAAILTPGVWADPLGAMVKTIPALVLVLVALAILEER